MRRIRRATATAEYRRDTAEAIGDFLDSMRFRQVDLLGAHSGAAVAAELAITRPKVVRRVVMVGAPALDDSERRTHRDLSPPEGTPRGALWTRAAVIDWDAAQRLPLLKQPLLVLRPHDNFWEAGGRVAGLVPGARVVDLPDQDRHLLGKSPALVAKHVRPFWLPGSGGPAPIARNEGRGQLRKAAASARPAASKFAGIQPAQIGVLQAPLPVTIDDRRTRWCRDCGPCSRRPGGTIPRR